MEEDILEPLYFINHLLYRVVVRSRGNFLLGGFVVFVVVVFRT